jgi:D-glycero-alpha-D-manno-heptose 1-phosphate guanylyltransferase
MIVGRQRSVAIAERAIDFLEFSLVRCWNCGKLSLRLIISTKHVVTLPSFTVSGYSQRTNQLANRAFATMMRKLEGNRDIPTGAVRAFVLCGGAGTRLRPVLADRPKAMALVSGTPFLQLLLDRLKSQGVGDVILGTGYMAERIERYFGSGNELAMRIRYSREHQPLGTGGALKLAEPLISDPVLVLNGDSYVEWSLVPMLELFAAKNADVVVVLQAVADVSRYGSVALDHHGRITQFIEKGVRGGPGLINAGIYLLRKEIVRDLPEGQAISLEREVFPSLLHRQVYGLVCHGLFIDIGIPDDLRQAQTLLAPHTRVEKPSYN